MRRGFTIIELMVVLSITAIGLTFAGIAFSGHFGRVSAERAAQVFAQDLTLVRSWAVRLGEPVVLRFYESSLWYRIEAQSTATEVASRRFGLKADIDLTVVTLDVAGDFRPSPES
jgi:prepilin-type N-terminal cleavage/methylation domain-containing protein